MAMNDFASLWIRVETTGAERATGQLSRLGSTAGQVERATSRATGEVSKFGTTAGRTASPVATLSTGFSRLATAGATAGAAVAAVAIPVGRATIEFQKQQGMLATATGSIENAGQAYEALADFAAQTPFSLQQATDGFVKLVNLGLTPSERALRSYGNTASAMGKDLSQMVEAVADASVGEFERLKEFGIKASAEGDRVRFTFRGATTEVARDAASIEAHLIRLGESNFGDAMAQQATTLGGALSNLGDSWDQLMIAIGRGQIGELMEGAVRKATAALDGLRAAIDGQPGKFKDFLTGWQLLWVEATGATMRFGIALGGVPEVVGAALDATIDVATAKFRALVERAEIYAGAVQHALANGLSLEGYDLAGKLEASATSIGDAATRGADHIRDAVDSADAGIAAKLAEQRQRQDDAIRELVTRPPAGPAATGDRLAQFEAGAPAPTATGGTGIGTGTPAPTATGGTGGGTGIGTGTGTGATDALGSLRAELATEEETINAAFQRRMEIVADNTAAESTLRADLVAKVDAQRTADLQSLAAHATAEQDMLAQRRESERQALSDSLLTAEEAITASYERRRAAILSAEQLTGTERVDMMTRLETQYQAQQQQYHLAQAQNMAQAGQQGFGALAALGKTFAGEQSQLYRVMFAASKAFAVAEAIIKIQQGIAQAAATPFPANIAAMATVAAATASIVPTITGANYAGGYDKGGTIPSGRYGLVGERGPELVAGPARVISRVATASALQSGAAQRVGGGAVRVRTFDAGGTIPRGQKGIVGERGPEIVLPPAAPVPRLPSRAGAAVASAPKAAPVTVSAPNVTVPVRVINSLDPAIVGDFLGGEDGERLVLNVMRRNQAALRGMLR